MPKNSLPNLFLARRLRELRIKAGFTQEAFAEESGMSYKVYQSIEAGRRWNLRMKTVILLANIHGVSLTNLFSRKTPKTRLKKPTTR
jgi:transcriptional regulator with XRE-family HTH domain